VKVALLSAVIALAGAATAFPAVDVRTLPSGVFEASGATGVPSGDGILFVDDGRPGEVFWMRMTDGASTPSIVPVALGGSIADPEGITNDGTWIYLVGSQSRGGKNSADLIRFRFDAAKGVASGMESLQGLPELLQGAVPDTGSGKSKDKGKDKKQRSELNIEGLAWDAAGKRLLLGLRSPLDGGDAIVIPLVVGSDALSASSVTVGAALRVPLGGSGIRSIEQAADGAFLIVAGGVTDASAFRLLSWSGSGAPREIMKFPAALKPEGIARMAAGGRTVTVVVGDSGRFAILD
jgi:hypothetical protein